jgi:hypothetical protein
MKRKVRAFLVSIFPLSVKHGITPIGAKKGNVSDLVMIAFCFVKTLKINKE